MKSYIVKLKETGLYFNVEFSFYNTIESYKMVKDKKKATIFQREELEVDTGKFNFHNIRATEFSIYLHVNMIINDVEIESVEAPEQPLFTNRQIRQLRADQEEWLSPIKNISSPKESKTPKNKQWIVAVDSDSFNYEPSLELISECKKEGIKGYRTKRAAQKRCDKLNSL